jgi:pyruvate,water dikinase
VTGQDLVRDLGEMGAGERPVVGGKGASLGELIRAGIRVPPGCVVTVRAFERALRALDPAGTIRREIERLPADDRAEIARVTARIRARIATEPLPEDVRKQIMARSGALGGDPFNGDGGVGGGGQPGMAVAVRSSATGEDGAEASFAGLQDTYLWVRGEDALLGAVSKCWASLYNAEAVGYRRRMKIGEQDLAMAVVVQRMVEPRCAGVMFTCSPTTGDRSVIAVEACWGLGSALVSGDVTPDCFVISKVTGEIVRRTVAAKLRRHQAGPGGRGVAAADVPAPLREQACLADAEIAALARIGQRVEEHYGAPQDIEWAITEGSRAEEGIVVLQSRPETVWARRRTGPVATAKARPADHVFEHLSRVVPAATAGPAASAPPATPVSPATLAITATPAASTPAAQAGSASTPAAQAGSASGAAAPEPER